MSDSGTLAELKGLAERRLDLCRRVREMLVDLLQLPFDPDWLTNDQPLFGRGIELDSVDALEIAMALEADFQLAISDDEVGVFGSVARMALMIDQASPVHPRELQVQPGEV